jgi:hypothetical protein
MYSGQFQQQPPLPSFLRTFYTRFCGPHHPHRWRRLLLLLLARCMLPQSRLFSLLIAPDAIKLNQLDKRPKKKKLFGVAALMGEGSAPPPPLPAPPFLFYN